LKAPALPVWGGPGPFVTPDYCAAEGIDIGFATGSTEGVSISTVCRKTTKM